MKRHMRDHTGENKVNCRFCGKSLGRKEYMQRHVRERCPARKDRAIISNWEREVYNEYNFFYAWILICSSCTKRILLCDSTLSVASFILTWTTLPYSTAFFIQDSGLRMRLYFSYVTKSGSSSRLTDLTRCNHWPEGEVTRRFRKLQVYERPLI